MVIARILRFVIVRVFPAPVESVYLDSESPLEIFKVFGQLQSSSRLSPNLGQSRVRKASLQVYSGRRILSASSRNCSEELTCMI